MGEESSTTEVGGLSKICRLYGGDAGKLDDDYYERPRENYESLEDKIRNAVVEMGNGVCSPSYMGTLRRLIIWLRIQRLTYLA